MMFAPSGPRLVHDALVSDVVQVQVRRDRNVRQQRVQRQRARVVRQQRRNNAAAVAAGAAAVGIIAGTALAAQRRSRIVCDAWGRCYRTSRTPTQYYYGGDYYENYYYAQPAPRVVYRRHYYGRQPYYGYGQRRVTGWESTTRWRSPPITRAPTPQYVPAPGWGRGGHWDNLPAAQAPDPTVSRPGISLGN
jgi:hypothetical protein